ncbi:MAG: right-handed parallel beta-helix repeat-containing protein [Anaerolineae bacterium]
MNKRKRVPFIFAAAMLAITLALLLLILLGGPARLVQADPGIVCVAPGGMGCSGPCGACYASVQAAVDAASTGDEILVATGVYTGVGVRPRNDFVTTGVVTQVVYVSKTVTVRGGYTTTNWTRNPISYPTTLDAEGLGRVIYATGDITLTLEGLRLTDGAAKGGGGIYTYKARPVVSDCHVYSNTVTNAPGGGIYLGDSDGAVLRDNRVYSNTAVYGGGIALVYSDDAVLMGNRVYSNTADLASGGGICLQVSHGVTLTGNAVFSNTAVEHGGGVYVEDSDYTVLTSNDIFGNTANQYGGGVRLTNNPTATLIGNAAYGNTANGYGGGINLVGCDNARLAYNDVFSNTANQMGGGVLLTSSDDITLAGNQVYRNTAATGGGGIELHSSGDAMLVNNVVVENWLTTSGGGAGILVVNAEARLLHTTIARNTGGHGSGVYLEPYGGQRSIVAMTNTILVSHTIGIEAVGEATATLEATLWGDGGWANITDTLGSAIFTGTQSYPHNPAFVDPDGGDYHIGSTSAAINKGVDTEASDDIDGDPRPFGGAPDLGADERVCFVRLNDISYDTVQAAIDASTSNTDVVKVAGICRGVQTRNSSQQVAYINKTLTLRGGYGPDFAVRDPDAYPTTLDAQRRGRVIYISGDVTPTVEGLILTGGNASNAGTDAGRGGGFYCSQAEALIVNNVITNNVASTSTTAEGHGGGLYLRYSDAMVSGNIIVSNTASTAHIGLGGGFYLGNSNATVSGNTIINNTAGAESESRGGGLHLYQSAATVSDNTICGNAAASGGGGSGGGLRLFYSDATIDGNTIVSNTADWGGGGLKSENSGFFTVTNNIIAQNRGTGGVYAWAHSSTPSQGVLVNNTVAGNGGYGVYLSEYSTLTLTNNIVVSHTTGVYARSNATNTVVADYTLFYGNTDDTDGGVIASTHEIIGEAPTFVNSAGWDYHLRAGSPAIDAGHPAGVPPAPTADIDGDTRPVDGDLDGMATVDIGADEFTPYRVYLPLTLRDHQ